MENPELHPLFAWLTMYIPPHFEEPRTDVLHALMRSRPLATLVTAGSAGIEANHLPLRLLAEPAPLGTLRGHVARANPVWRSPCNGNEVLAVFHGPDAYITPGWYPTKAETGKAVPTWNYAVVHAYGTMRLIDDAAWLRAELEALTDTHESGFSEPWRVSDAPRDYTDALLSAVVGIEITITRLSGKWKLGQNQPARNRAGMIGGLRARGSAAAAELANLIGHAAERG